MQNPQGKAISRNSREGVSPPTIFTVPAESGTSAAFRIGSGAGTRGLISKVDTRGGADSFSGRSSSFTGGGGTNASSPSASSFGFGALCNPAIICLYVK